MIWKPQPEARLAWCGAFAVFVPRFALTPVTVGRTRYEMGPAAVEWRSLYVFGLRIARWTVTYG